MELRDLLLVAPEDDIDRAVEYIASKLLGLDSYYLSRRDAHLIGKYLEKLDTDLPPPIGSQYFQFGMRFATLAESKSAYWDIYNLNVSGSHDDFADWIIETLDTCNDALIRSALTRINKSPKIFAQSAHLRPALILSQFHPESLRRIALMLDIDITQDNNNSGSIFQRMRPGNKHWSVVSKMCELIEPEAHIEVSFPCPDCGNQSPQEATHCIYCGRSLPVPVCPKCGAENILIAKFCMGCGEKR